MRLTIITLFLLIIFGLSASNLRADNEPNSKTVSVGVKGMTCGFCTRGIRKRFEKLPGVESAAPNVEEKRVVLKLKAELTVTDEEIKKVVDDSGYELTSIDRGESGQIESATKSTHS